MYVRVIPALAAHHDVWKRLVLRAQNLTAVLEGGALGRRLRDFRFSPVERLEPHAAEWWRE